jgi:hypothetical protein
VKRDGWIYIMLVTNGECSYTMHNVQCTMYNVQSQIIHTHTLLDLNIVSVS